jgi:hypothetical protein
MQMKVDRSCGRCNKIKTIEVDIETAQALIQEDMEKKKALEVLENFAANLLVEHNPDIIIMVKNDTGYNVETLDNLCFNPNNKTRFRGCAPRVIALLDDIFQRTPKKSPKKTKEPSDG